MESQALFSFKNLFFLEILYFIYFTGSLRKENRQVSNSWEKSVFSDFSAFQCINAQFWICLFLFLFQRWKQTYFKIYPQQIYYAKNPSVSHLYFYININSLVQIDGLNSKNFGYSLHLTGPLCAPFHFVNFVQSCKLILPPAIKIEGKDKQRVICDLKRVCTPTCT